MFGFIICLKGLSLLKQVIWLLWRFGLRLLGPDSLSERSLAMCKSSKRGGICGRKHVQTVHLMHQNLLSSQLATKRPSKTPFTFSRSCLPGELKLSCCISFGHFGAWVDRRQDGTCIMLQKRFHAPMKTVVPGPRPVPFSGLRPQQALPACSPQ